MKDHPEVYLGESSLVVEDVLPSAPLLFPKVGKSGGFQERAFTRHERYAVVKVVGFVSESPAPDKVFNEFVAACRAKAPERRLVVQIKKTYQARERRFELDVLPGHVFRRKDDKEAAGYVLRDAKLDVPADGGEPTGVRGTTVAGVTVVIPKDQIDPQDWNAFAGSAGDAGGK